MFAVFRLKGIRCLVPNKMATLLSLFPLGAWCLPTPPPQTVSGLSSHAGCPTEPGELGRRGGRGPGAASDTHPMGVVVRGCVMNT